MSSAIAATVVTVGAGLYASKKAGDRADDQMEMAQDAAELEYKISKEQVDLAKEQWSYYKSRILPLEQQAQKLGINAQQLAQQRGEADLKAYTDYYLPMQESFVQDAMDGIEADPERAARDARIGVDQQFDSAEGQIRRDEERRGVRPGAGASTGTQDITLNRAAATAYNVNRAVEAERDRVEDVNFNRKATALGRQPLAANPTQSPGSPGITAGVATAGLGAAGRTAYGAGQQFGNLGQAYGDASAGALGGGIQLGMQAYDTFNKWNSTQNFGFAPGGGANFAASGGYGTTPGSQQTNMLADQNMGFAEGGPVNAPGPELTRGAPMAPNPGGQVNGPPGRDQVPAYIEGNDGQRYDARLQDNEFVIPADVVRDVGEGTIEQIINKSRERRQKARGTNSLSRPGGRS